MKPAAWLLLFSCLFGMPRAAHALELNGKFTQGGLVIGHAAPGSKVFLDGQPIAAATDGSFLVGFGRDAATTAALRVVPPDGKVETRRLAVAPRKYLVQRINGLPKRVVTPNPEDLARIKKDIAEIHAVRRETTLKPFFESGFVWPVTGRISGVFGSQRVLDGKPRAPHNGVDIAAAKGTPIHACADGTVALVNRHMFLTGETVMIDHGLGLTSVYIHMSQVAVKVGDKVTKGQPIGAVGMTGRATGPHLHWGVSWHGTHLDPALLVGPQPGG